MALTTVAVLVRDELSLFEFAVTAEIFGIDRTDDGVPPFDFRVCAERFPAVLRTKHTAAVGLTPSAGLSGLAGADVVIVSAVRPTRCTDAERQALRAAHAAGATLVSLCSGAFLLADAGLLDGRRCTTHWMDAARLAREFPALEVCDDELFVDEGSVITTAGTAAAVDACLHLVRRELGTGVAGTIARRMVVPPHRSGGQRQYVARPIPQTPQDGLGPTMDWLLRDLRTPRTVDEMARQAGLSRRHFIRRFEEQTGTTPGRWLTEQRIGAAQALLESSDLPVERVAGQVGYSSAAQLRVNFERITGTGPASYRATFRGAGRR